MKKKYIAVSVLLLIAVAITSYFIGYKVAYDRIERSAEAQNNETQTFYATIVEADDTHFLVKGIEANDINYRGEFTFSIKEETSYTWRGTEISPSDLEVGDTISITFSGEVLTIYPVIISNVIKVQLLEDEI